MFHVGVCCVSLAIYMFLRDYKIRKSFRARYGRKVGGHASQPYLTVANHNSDGSMGPGFIVLC